MIIPDKSPVEVGFFFSCEFAEFDSKDSILTAFITDKGKMRTAVAGSVPVEPCSPIDIPAGFTLCETGFDDYNGNFSLHGSLFT